MSILGTFVKQPSEKLDYDVDFSTWLTDDTLFSQTTAITGPDSTLVADTSSIMQGGFVVKNILMGGTVGNKYKVTVTATTTVGLIKEAEFIVSIKEY
jgi:hypothetical protein